MAESKFLSTLHCVWKLLLNTKSPLYDDTCLKNLCDLVGKSVTNVSVLQKFEFVPFLEALFAAKDACTQHNSECSDADGSDEPSRGNLSTKQGPADNTMSCRQRPNQDANISEVSSSDTVEVSPSNEQDVSSKALLALGDASVYVFALDTCGHLICSSEIFQYMMESGTFDRVFGWTLMYNDPSLLTAVYISLAKCTRHLRGLNWIFNSQTEWMLRAWQSLSSESMFTREAARTLISSSLQALMRQPTLEPSLNLWLLDSWQKIQNILRKDYTQKETGIRIIDLACNRTHDSQSISKTSDERNNSFNERCDELPLASFNLKGLKKGNDEMNRPDHSGGRSIPAHVCVSLILDILQDICNDHASNCRRASEDGQEKKDDCARPADNAVMEMCQSHAPTSLIDTPSRSAFKDKPMAASYDIMSRIEFVDLLWNLVRNSETTIADKVMKILFYCIDHLWPDDVCTAEKGKMAQYWKKCTAKNHELIKQKLVLEILKRTKDLEEKSALTSCLLKPLRDITCDKQGCTSELDMTSVLTHGISCIPTVIEKINQDEVIQLMTKLLKVTELTDGWHCSHKFNRRKVQHSLVQCLLQCKDQIIIGSFQILEKLGASILAILNRPGQDANFVSSMMLVAMAILPTLTGWSHSCPASVEYVSCLQKKLCDLKWEVRDSGAEAVTKLIMDNKDCAQFSFWLKQSRLHLSVWQMLEDSESYVRASAITMGKQLLLLPHVWTDLLANIEQNQKTAVSKIQHIIHNDTEAFPRREAMSFLFIAVENHYVTMTDIAKTLILASSDFDWEVKLGVLNILELSLSQKSHPEMPKEIIPEYAASLVTIPRTTKKECSFCKVEMMLKIDCAQVLISLSNDYDQSVCTKATEILLGLTRNLHEYKSRTNICDNDSIMRYSNASKRQKLDPDCGQLSRTSQGEGNSNQYVDDVKKCRDPHPKSRAFLDSLDDNKLESQLVSLRRGTDEYSKHPLSLLQDILMAAQDKTEDHFVDCY